MFMTPNAVVQARAERSKDRRLEPLAGHLLCDAWALLELEQHLDLSVSRTGTALTPLLTRAFPASRAAIF